MIVTDATAWSHHETSMVLLDCLHSVSIVLSYSRRSAQPIYRYFSDMSVKYRRAQRAGEHSKLTVRAPKPPPPPPLFYIGWVGVGWQRHCKTCHSLRELDNQGTVFLCVFFGGRPQPVIELDHLCEVKNIYFAQLGMIVSRSIQGKAPKRQIHRTPIAVSGNAYTGN